MRAGPLSDPPTAAFIRKDFICAWEKKGAVESYRVRGAPEENFKVGGNILSYVCTPEGRVLHALPGSWKPEIYREHLDWARILYRELVVPGGPDVPGRLRAAHQEPQGVPRWNMVRTAHQRLVTRAFRPIAEIEKMMFEEVLGQTYAPEKDIVVREIDQDDYRKAMANLPQG
jgi:hypothetical protein